MDDEVFNLEIRKFLKRFGVTAQREIERSVTEAISGGKLGGTETLRVQAILTIPGVLDAHRIDGEIALTGPASAA
jgi:hypothetical protein